MISQKPFLSSEGSTSSLSISSKAKSLNSNTFIKRLMKHSKLGVAFSSVGVEPLVDYPSFLRPCGGKRLDSTTRNGRRGWSPSWPEEMQPWLNQSKISKITLNLHRDSSLSSVSRKTICWLGVPREAKLPGSSEPSGNLHSSQKESLTFFMATLMKFW
jgi:hypothetical protein